MNNFVCVRGNVIADVDVRFTKNGKQCSMFRVAVNENRKNENGEWESKAVAFLNMIAWEYVAKQCEQLKKGDGVVVTGKITTGSYEKDGVKKYTTEIIVSGIARTVKTDSTSNFDDFNKPAGEETPF